ncbi:hypothetical protein CP533_2952 [Ophiocordyceps camponoti-saundersi (nom. inval.)]|nr:hypothetical protein CP533_2952 [Ophiocordyceps camponoti-saundersi (nom. inval.)]
MALIRSIHPRLCTLEPPTTPSLSSVTVVGCHPVPVNQPPVDDPQPAMHSVTVIMPDTLVAHDTLAAASEYDVVVTDPFVVKAAPVVVVTQFVSVVVFVVVADSVHVVSSVLVSVAIAIVPVTSVRVPVVSVTVVQAAEFDIVAFITPEALDSQVVLAFRTVDVCTLGWVVPSAAKLELVLQDGMMLLSGPVRLVDVDSDSSVTVLVTRCAVPITSQVELCFDGGDEVTVLGHGVGSLARVSGTVGGRGHKVDSPTCAPDAVPSIDVDSSPAFGPGPGTGVAESTANVEDEVETAVSGSSLRVTVELVPGAGLGHSVDSLACVSTSGSSVEAPLAVEWAIVGLGHKVDSLACEADDVVEAPELDVAEEVPEPMLVRLLGCGGVGLGHRVDSLACEADVDIAETRRVDQPLSKETEEATPDVPLDKALVAGELYRRDVGLGHKVDSTACEPGVVEGVSDEATPATDELSASDGRRVDQWLEGPGKPEDCVIKSVLPREDVAEEEEIQVATADEEGVA